MWKFLFATCCLFFYVQGIPAPGRGGLTGYCNTNEHCSQDECCVSFERRRGRRGLSGGVRRLTRGKCEKRGTSGSKCLVRNLQSLVKDIYFDFCPCQVDHKCEGTRSFLVPQGELGSCVRKCSSSNDCGPKECCVSDFRPIGKRSADRVKRQSSGHCRPMGKKGSNCLVKNGSGRPDGTVFHSCPCMNYMTCMGTGIFDIPLGEMGRCG